MRSVAALSLVLLTLPLNAQTVSTRCGTEEVRVGTRTIDLLLLGCGEGFADNVLWHLDRADSTDGSLNSKVTRTATGKGAVVYLCDTGVMRDHDEFARADGSVVIGSIAVNGFGSDCPAGRNPALDPCWKTDAALSIYSHGTATASMIAGRNTGTAPDAKIVSVFMETVGTDIDGWIRTFDAIIHHAFDAGTPQFKTGIISMSFVPNYASAKDPNFPAFEKKMREMIAEVDAGGNADPSGKRFLFVTVAGNHLEGNGDQCDKDMNTNLFPAGLGASIDGLITVGGIDETNRVWDRSCRGAAVDILAPASDLLVATANADEPTAGGRVAVFDGIFAVSGRRAGRR